MLLQGKVAVITGVGEGLGKAIAFAFSAHGASIAIAARNEARLEAVASDIRKSGGDVIVVPTDVTSATQCQHLADEVAAHYGHIDCLVHNAFVQPPFELLANQSVELIRENLEINLVAALTVSQPIIEKMRGSGSGSITFTNSIIVRRAMPYFGAYKMAKQGLLGLAQGLACELGKEQIRVNSVAPGYIWGDELKKWMRETAETKGISYEAMLESIEQSLALGRITTPEQISDAIVFLASSMASAITGHCIDVNSGELT